MMDPPGGLNGWYQANESENAGSGFGITGLYNSYTFYGSRFDAFEGNGDGSVDLFESYKNLIPNYDGIPVNETMDMFKNPLPILSTSDAFIFGRGTDLCNNGMRFPISTKIQPQFESLIDKSFDANDFKCQAMHASQAPAEYAQCLKMAAGSGAPEVFSRCRRP